jgi:protein involved in polysaccharide export with SLBB domain
MIDPLPAAGALPGDLQQRIADKYREANLIPQATVTVSVAAPPTTQASAAATQPATQPIAAAATTQPAPPDAGINVVVLIEKSASVLPPK